MISSIFHGLLICYSHSSLSKDQIVPKHSSVTHGCTQIAPWITRTVIWATLAKQATQQTHLCLKHQDTPPTPSPPQRQESMIQTASKLLCHLSSLGFIWRMRIWLLRQNHFHTYSPQPAGTVLIVRPSTVSTETTIIWGPSWTVDSTHLTLNSRKRQGWRQILKVCGKWFSAKHGTTKNFYF